MKPIKQLYNQMQLYQQIEEKMDEEFEREYPSTNQTEEIITDKELILDEFEKWYNFWAVRDPNLVDSTNDKILLIKKNICELRIVELINNIDTLGLKKELFNRLNTTSDNISKTRKKMKILNDISLHLYNECIKEMIYDSDEENNKILDPVNWLVNQEIMRKLYESYINKTMVSDNIWTKQLSNNNFIKYMKFMYDNYPVGFGKELLNKYENNEICDASAIYYKKIAKTQKID